MNLAVHVGNGKASDDDHVGNTRDLVRGTSDPWRLTCQHATPDGLR
jgi:hypothetical protein